MTLKLIAWSALTVISAPANAKTTVPGHYDRKLHTMAGEINVKMPKLRKQTLDTTIIERYQRRGSSVEEPL